MKGYIPTYLHRETLRELFDSRYPVVGVIRKRYKMVDLNKETSLDSTVFAEAVAEAARQGVGLYVPQGFAGWDQNGILAKKIGSEKVLINLNTPYRFKKFGPEVNINTTRMGVGEASETDFQELMRTELSEAKNRQMMREGTRGEGWWRPRQKDHVIIPWPVFVEGYIYATQNNLGGRSQIMSMTKDAVVKVHSLSKYPHAYTIHISSLPTGEEYKLEVFQTEWRGDSCENVIYSEFASRLPRTSVVSEDPRIVAAWKYSKPEHVVCRHAYTAEWVAREHGRRYGPKVKVFRYPEPRPFFAKVFSTLKMKTIIGDEKKGERPTKAFITSACGMVIGLKGPDEMFVFDI